MADMLRTSTPLRGHDWFSKVQRMLQAIAWAMRSTVNTAVQYTPGQMVFQRDMITASQIRVDWDRIFRDRARNAARGIARENAARIEHQYVSGQQVWVKLHPSNRKWKLNAPFEGPFPIIEW